MKQFYGKWSLINENAEDLKLYTLKDRVSGISLPQNQTTYFTSFNYSWWEMKMSKQHTTKFYSNAIFLKLLPKKLLKAKT